MAHIISLPVSLIPLVWKQADLEPVSKREFFQNSTSSTLRYRFVQKERKCDPSDPWKLRDEFLAWRIEDWQAFFFVAGGWSGSPYITQSDFAEWQQLLRDALVRPAKDWRSLAGQFAPGKVSKLTGPLRILFDWRGTVPAAKVVLTDSLTAIIATIQVEKLQGAEFRVCARHDCPNPPFKVEARHKIYCCMDCAHLVAVRNSRRRAAERAERKRK